MRRETGWSPMEKLRFSAYSRVEGVVDEPDVRPEYCISELLYVSQITQRHKGKRRHREKPALQGSFEAGFSLCLRAFVSLCYCDTSVMLAFPGRHFTLLRLLF